MASAIALSLISPYGDTAANAAFPGRPGRIFFSIGITGNQDLYSVRSDGTGMRRLTSTKGSDVSAKVSADGRRVVYSCRGNAFSLGAGEICVMNSDGSGERNLTRSAEVEDDPAWSADGKSIVFIRKVSEDRPEIGADTDIFVMNADGSDITRLTSGLDHDRVPEWSPDGSKIVFERTPPEGGTHIWAMNADGSGQVNLTPSQVLQRRDEASPSWSPDGEQILFTRDTSERRQLFTMNSDGTGVKAIEHRGDVSRPSWSPNGRKIVYQAIYRSDRVVLYVMDRDGSDRRMLIQSLRTDNHSADWQAL